MTTEEAIRRAALRKHRHKTNHYEVIHHMLLAELGWAEEQQMTPHLSWWQRVKRWFS